jgi:hypothetical protein
MKKRLAKCDVCKEITVHSLSHRGTSGGKTKRDVDRCDECQTTTIRGRSGTKTFWNGRKQ